MSRVSPSSKRCFACREVKAIGEFYAHQAMADGHLGKCKPCARFDASARRANTLDRVRAYDRRRASDPGRRANAQRVSAAWHASHPEWRRTHSAVQRALRDGRLERPDRCQACSTAGKVEAHHFDYAKPLDVVWLCKPCHADADRVRSDR